MRESINPLFAISHLFTHQLFAAQVLCGSVYSCFLTAQHTHTRKHTHTHTHPQTHTHTLPLSHTHVHTRAHTHTQSFEDATYALQVGEISGVVDSDSGLHIILRTK